MSKPSSLLPENYDDFLRSLKERIRQAQVRAVVAVNSELVLLYWEIGRAISERYEREGWGAKSIDRLAKDLKREFPDISGFSPRNLRYMRTFAETYTDQQILQQVVAKIPWGHNVRLLDQVRETEIRIWYAQQTITYGWSRAVLEYQIETELYQRQGNALNNFETTLPAPQSDLTREMLKDPYSFAFLSLGQEAKERDLENALLARISSFLLELGVGFAFVGRQYHLEVGNQDFYLDLLFYHLKLRCYVVIDLKATEFKPEHSGKMNFYVSAVDDLLRHPDDQPTIGLILCKSRNKTIAEYALRGVTKPIAVSEYRHQLPSDLQAALPTVEQLEAELATIEAEFDAENQVPEP
jgi:predicted nuclease of restriction endonuclease-like (RecB) superfamily